MAPDDKRHRYNQLHRCVHPAFGMWADRTDIVSSVDLADELRRKIEERSDGQSID